MITPQNTEKSLDDWTFDELVKWACWEVVQGMYSDKPLRSTMYSILMTSRQWKPKEAK